MCDIQFSVGSDGGCVEQIGAHKSYLISRSPVFFAMFCGDLSESGAGPIRVPDIEPLAFKQMLRSVCHKSVRTFVCLLYASEIEYMLCRLLAGLVIYMKFKPNYLDLC